MTRVSSTLPPPIHPFPARMAPEIAIHFCRELPRGALVLDPMVGSGTTVRAAVDSGHRAVGLDMDPLAVLISRAWTTRISPELLEQRAAEVARSAALLAGATVSLPWIDQDRETLAYTERWFGPEQRLYLRALASVLIGRHGASWNLCRVALSKTIITKDRGASLARDVSHSRPHKVMEASDYDVIAGFEKAASILSKRMQAHPPLRRASIRLGDARVDSVPERSVDAVITSPPYLNAIDYIRGHRMSLVWMGYTLAQLRRIRSAEVGAERSLSAIDLQLEPIYRAMGDVDALPARYQGMVRRYVSDVDRILLAIRRALCHGGRALLVVGNSSLQGVFLRNDKAVELAALRAGLTLDERFERLLPPNRRYLPPPALDAPGLDQRMRSEVVLTFGG